MNLALLALTVLLVPPAERPGPLPSGATRLVTGQLVTPVGDSVTVSDLPTEAKLSPDGKTLAVATGGAGAHRVYLLEPSTGKIRQDISLSRSQLAQLCWTRDSKTLFIGGGNSGKIHQISLTDDGVALPKDPIVLVGKSYQGGLALSQDEKTLFVSDLESASVRAISLPGGTETARASFTPEEKPASLTLSPDGATLYAALWSSDRVAELDSTTLTVKRTLTVGAMPSAIVATDRRLFVACASADTVFVLDSQSGQVQEKLKLSLAPGTPIGATPTALALAPGGKKLLVACSDLNAVAVIDVETVGKSVIKGFVPTAHYPSAVAFTEGGRKFLVGSAKGLGTGPNPTPPGEKRYPYITTLLKGLLSTVETPDSKQLAIWTKQVLINNPVSKNLPRRNSSPVPSKLGDSSPIQYVLYIIKENRTYDQVFGDIGKGESDPNLCLFGENVTPNHHALAREFVLFDNLYASGEVSVDGHHWSNGAYVPASRQKTWPAQYGAKGAPPIREGDFNDGLATPPAGRLWDVAGRAKIPYKTYYYHTLKNHSPAWTEARNRGERDYVAADIFIKELTECEKNNNLPRLMVMALSEDHTRGTTVGAPTPQAAVASNDLALGKIVEACSKSKFWPKMAIFVIEDDAQNGPDHIDAHRTVGLVISPYTRRTGFLDSTFYNTTSMLRTMELILNLPPMSAFDASATPMHAAFTDKPDPTSFVCRPAKIDLNAKNGSVAYGAARSKKFDFSKPDQLSLNDEDALNRILWHAVKGKNAPYPGITRRPWFGKSGHSTVREGDDD